MSTNQLDENGLDDSSVMFSQFFYLNKSEIKQIFNSFSAITNCKPDQSIDYIQFITYFKLEELPLYDHLFSAFPNKKADWNSYFKFVLFWSLIPMVVEIGALMHSFPDNNGCISLNDIEYLCGLLKRNKCAIYDIRDTFLYLDINKDGLLTYPQFCELILQTKDVYEPIYRLKISLLYNIFTNKIHSENKYRKLYKRILNRKLHIKEIKEYQRNHDNKYKPLSCVKTLFSFLKGYSHPDTYDYEPEDNNNNIYNKYTENNIAYSESIINNNNNNNSSFNVSKTLHFRSEKVSPVKISTNISTLKKSETANDSSGYYSRLEKNKSSGIMILNSHKSSNCNNLKLQINNLIIYFIKKYKKNIKINTERCEIKYLKMNYYYDIINEIDNFYIEINRKEKSERNILNVSMSRLTPSSTFIINTTNTNNNNNTIHNTSIIMEDSVNDKSINNNLVVPRTPPILKHSKFDFNENDFNDEKHKESGIKEGKIENNREEMNKEENDDLKTKKSREIILPPIKLKCNLNPK